MASGRQASVEAIFANGRHAVFCLGVARGGVGSRHELNCK